MIIGIAIAHPLLSLFGTEYAALGATALQLVLIGCLPRLLVLLTIGVSQAQGKGCFVAALQLSSAATMIPVALFVPADLTYIGLGFAVVQVLVATVAGFVLRGPVQNKETEKIVPVATTGLAA